MKRLVVALVLTLTVMQPAHAGILRKVLGAPFYAVGFTIALVADVVATPFKQGADHYVNAPAVKGW